MIFKKFYFILFILLGILFSLCSKDEDKSNDSLTVISKSKSEFIIQTLFSDDVFTSDASLGLDYGIGTIYFFKEFYSGNGLNKVLSNEGDTVFIVNYSNSSDTVQIYYLKSLKKFFILYAGNESQSGLQTTYNFFAEVILYGTTGKALTYTQIMAKVPIVKYKFSGEIECKSSSKDNFTANSNSDFNYTIELVDQHTYKLNGDAELEFDYNKDIVKLKLLVQDFFISDLTDYPSGIYKLEGGNGSYMKIIFDGTSIAKVEIFDGENTYNMELDLDTNKLTDSD